MDTHRLTPDRYVSLLRSESTRFAALLSQAEPTAPVPSCPDWDAADLLWHLTEVQWFWATIAGERLRDPSGLGERRPPRPPAYADLLTQFAQTTARLADALADADDAEPAYTWLPGEQTVGFIRRRQAHEVLIHRVDAELVVGEPTGLDPELASDGVDEALQIMFGGIPGWATFTRQHGPVAVRAIDTGARWLVDVGAQSGTSPESGEHVTEPTLDVRADQLGDAPAAVAEITAAAGPLDSWLWGRADSTAVDTDGDRAAIAALEAVIGGGID